MNDLSVIIDEFGDLTSYQNPPDFWPSELEKGAAVINGLASAEVSVIGHSAGGREIVMLAYGEKEPLDATTDNLISTLASGAEAQAATRR